MSRSIPLILAPLTLVILLLAGCAEPVSSPGPPGESPISLLDCVLDLPGIEEGLEARCGRLTVPENRDEPGGRQIELYVVVVPAVNRNARRDPLFLLAGGPGQAATETYPVLVLSTFGRVHEDRDIVLVDQRGTGQSNPLECELPEEDDPTEEEVITALQDCASELDADPRFYTTDVAVRDLEQVRAALGYERLNLYGASYGTRVALAYLRRYPARVRSIVLDAVVDTSFYIYETAGRDGTRAMNALFARCRTDVACRQAFPDLQAEFESLLAQLEVSPVEVRISDPVSGEPETLTLTRQRFATMAYALLYTPELVSLFPLSVHAAYAEGDFGPLLAQAAASDAGLYVGMLYAVVCTEDAPFIDPQEASALAEGTYFGDMSQTMRRVCEAWPQGLTSPDLHRPVSSDVPVFLLSGEVDPITPPQYAARAAETLTNSLLLVVPEMSHGVAMRGCLPRVMADFYDAGSVDGLDVACVQEIEAPPFFIDYVGPQP